MTGPGLDVFTFGETMVSLRSAGPLAAGGALSMHVAGAESNVAVALARLGHRSGWGGRIGGDELGEFVLRRLRGEGVDTEDVVVDLERPTGLMLLEQRTADVARVQYHRARSAGSALSADDLRGPLTAGARVLHLTGITPALSGSAREATLWAAGAASAAGVPVCLDVNYRARLWPRDEARSVLAPLAVHASIVVASHDELDLVGPARTKRPSSRACAVEAPTRSWSSSAPPAHASTRATASTMPRRWR